MARVIASVLSLFTCVPLASSRGGTAEGASGPDVRGVAASGSGFAVLASAGVPGAGAVWGAVIAAGRGCGITGGGSSGATTAEAATSPVIPRAAASHFIAPPLIISKGQIDELVGTIADVLKTAA